MMKDLKEVVDKVKGVEDGVSNLLIPILQDTIKDCNKHNTKLFILNILLAIFILIIAIFSQVLVIRQNEKYSDFLSQFEIESDIYQDVDNYSVINDGISVSK